MENKFKVMIFIIVGALVLSVLLLAFRGTAITQAYENAQPYNITYTNSVTGAEVTETVAGSDIDGETVASVYGILTGLVWLIAVIACLIIAVKF